MATIQMQWLGKQWLQLNFLFKRDDCGAGLTRLTPLNGWMNYIRTWRTKANFGACNDLVLCCPTKVDQREYYICNPYTKKWVALPPPPQIHYFVSIGWRVVRLRAEFYVDIFFSETGEWRESANVVCSSRKYFDIVTAGVACNGKLYFAGTDCVTSSYVLELDPFQGDDNLKWRLLVDQVPLFQMESSNSEDPFMPLDEWGKKAIGFHPNIEAIYVDAGKVIRCNFGARMLELVPEIPGRGLDWYLFYIHPFVLPWWPTPVPSL
ncbi:hypothetical protein Pyn_14248 [Prunus yedoensis var. nudiflora]|uniref:F-box protein At3g26010-like beta-propeller domain-containing protein n=1 Tax=Prunus yedoensis var. nudiflora TaxID=2094558 RepID=A0A314Y6K6_PRUYE|nr:hypothetical protein Pyn_14248 [Prunus yedoensis var. nudiflora]